MDREEQVRQLIYETLTDLNRQLPPGERLQAAASTVLFDGGAGLDSLGLVNLIYGLEQRLASQLGITVDLADEALTGRTDNPFRSVGDLSAYVASLLQ